MSPALVAVLLASGQVIAQSPAATPAAPASTPAEAAKPAVESSGATKTEGAPKPDSTQQIDNAMKGETAGYYAAAPEGKTLPENVVRVRVPFKYITGSKGFDKDGKEIDLGLKANVTASAFVVEYGITDSISAQFLMPLVLQNNLSLNGDTFRNSALYKDKKAQMTGALYSGIIAGLVKAGSCADAASCQDDINAGKPLPFEQTITLPTGETVVLESGVAIKTVVENKVDSLIVNAAAPKSGKTGIGDLEIGVLYSILNERGPLTNSPIFFAAGLGIRLPTGHFSDVPSAYRGTGRGTTDLGIRTNLDYVAMPGLVFSVQNQTEIMLVKGTKKKSSLANPEVLNEADPTTSAAVAAGSDGKRNSQTFERKGARNVGFLKGAFGLGVLSQELKAVGTNVQWKYDIDAPEYLDGIGQGDGRRQAYTLLFGAGFDALAYRLPFQVDVEYEMPVAGKNNRLATHASTMTLKGFYKF